MEKIFYGVYVCRMDGMKMEEKRAREQKEILPFPRDLSPPTLLSPPPPQIPTPP